MPSPDYRCRSCMICPSIAASPPRAARALVRPQALRTWTTTSAGGSAPCTARNVSRTIRFARLRSTARPSTLLLTMIPSRAGPAGRASARTMKQGLTSAGSGDARTASNSPRRRSFSMRPGEDEDGRPSVVLRPRDGRALSRAAPAPLLCRRASSSGRETRGCACDGSLTADRSSSWSLRPWPSEKAWYYTLSPEPVSIGVSRSVQPLL